MTLILAVVALAAPACSADCQQRVINAERREVVRPHRAWLRRLRACESTNNYRAVSSSGTYTGAYQFDDRTWRSVGGHGRAMHAGKLEQDFRAVRLRKQRGSAPWPVCAA